MTLISFKDFPIKWKLTVIIMLTIMIALVTSFGAFLAYDSFNQKELMKKEQIRDAKVLAARSVNAVESNDRALAQAALADLSDRLGFDDSACIYSRDGKIIAKRPSATPDIQFPRWDMVNYSKNGYYVALEPVRRNEQRIGTVCVKANQEERLIKRKRQYADIILMVLLIASLVGFLVSYKLQRLISEPIIDLANVALAVFEKKDYSVRAVKKTRDEIGVLIDSFNRMLGGIQTRDAELHLEKQKTEEANKNLEMKVELRTSELARATMEAQEAREASELANQTKSAFLANMSHELRTPLNAIIGYSEMLEEEAKELGEEAFVADLKKIHGAGKHLLGLINDVLDISKIEAGKMELYLESFDVMEMIQETTNTVIPLVEQNSDSLAVECDENLGKIYSDATKVRQALLNLLSNACKFTSGGQITLRVRRETVEGKEWVYFSVADTGIGMTREQMGRLFQAFIQADAGTTKKFGGTGLGLAITKRFCQLMGGDVTVESEYGKGSTFTIKLPVQAPPKTETAVGDGAKESAAAHEILANANRVLVIDDDPTVHDLMRRFLGKEGYLVETAANGRDGLRRAREFKPDAITLDVMMPDMDGWSVLSALKADPQLSEIPVIMLTMLDDKNIGFALGASEYLNKPIQRDQLSTILKKYRRDQGSAVLVVEDDGVIRQMVKSMLEKEGWLVSEAENGKVALARITERLPALVLLDLMMPVMDGFEFLTELKKRPDWSKIPVVIVTARELSVDDRARLQGKVEKILQKGMYSREELINQLRNLISSRAHEKSTPSLN